MQKNIYIIDFDSTFIQSEGLEELAAIALKGHPKREDVLKEIAAITKLGMEGKISFDSALSRRLKLLVADTNDIDKVVKTLKRQISVSVKRNKQFFTENNHTIYIISGGFKEFIVPIVSQYGISDDHVFANSFTYDKEGKITGYDKKNPLAQRNGKALVVQKLTLKGNIFVIGDGFTDYQIKEYIPSAQFYAFTENITRELVTKKADRIVKTFDEFLFINKLPRSLSYPKNRLKVVLLENIHGAGESILEKDGFSVNTMKKALAGDLLKTHLSDAAILGIRSRTKLSADILAAAPRLLSVGAFCIGTDQIDLAEATNRGIAVFNAPYSNTRSVVELILGEIIMLARNIFPKSAGLHNGVWDKSAEGSFEVRGKTLGIIGYGNIGSQLSVLAENMGMRVFFYDKAEKLALGNAKSVTFTELLRTADIVTVHVDGRSGNENLIGEKEFSLMKKGVIFLNASRGAVVDIASLTRNLRNGKLQGAAIDVFPEEPEGKDKPFISELRGIPNIILTPHIGGSTAEAQENIGRFVSLKIIDYINTGSTDLSVNLPQLQLPEQKDSHRLLHLHKNTPGVLARITNTLASSNANIIGQYLKTNDTVGYVITDIDKKYDTKMLDALKKIPDTIRFRVLY
jgi:D-3-phosphoglycerate dehydrogenase / 2-oxoglutarate reductase